MNYQDLNCPNEEIRLAWLHEVLEEMVPTQDIGAVQNHLAHCDECQRWRVKEQAFDSHWRAVVASPGMAPEMPEMVDVVPGLQAAMVEKRRKFVALSFLGLAGMGWSLIMGLVALFWLRSFLPAIGDFVEVGFLYLQAGHVSWLLPIQGAAVAMVLLLLPLMLWLAQRYQTLVWIDVRKGDLR